jgi:hypothetical protein
MWSLENESTVGMLKHNYRCKNVPTNALYYNIKFLPLKY